MRMLRAVDLAGDRLVAMPSEQPTCACGSSRQRLHLTQINARTFFRHFRRKSFFGKEFRSADDCAPEFRRCALTTHESAPGAR
jgi:hypothetical protein